MRIIFYSFLNFCSTIIISLKNFIWGLNLSNYHCLKVYKNSKFNLVHYGDIAKMIYSRQHLVKFNKGFEFEIFDIFLEKIELGSIILDIGANIGLFSLLGADKISSTGKVYAFEPAGRTFESLNSNLETNNIENVKTFNIALSDSVGLINLSSTTSSKNSYQYNDAFNYLDFNNKNKDGEQVLMTTLDLFVTENAISNIDLIKVDIEGSELFFFKGGQETLKKFKPTIIFECAEHHCKKYNITCFETLNFLNSIGYKLEQIGSANWIASFENK